MFPQHTLSVLLVIRGTRSPIYVKFGEAFLCIRLRISVFRLYTLCPLSLFALASVIHVDLEHYRMCYSCAIIYCSFHSKHLLRPYFSPMCSLVEIRIDRISKFGKTREFNKRDKRAVISKAAQSCSVFLPVTLSFHSIWVLLLKTVSTKPSKHIWFAIGCAVKSDQLALK